MACCCFGNLAAFQWKCAAAPAQRQFGVRDVFFADMHKQRVSKRRIKSAEGLPKTSSSDSVHVRFGRSPLPFVWSIGLSSAYLFLALIEA